MKPVKRLLLVLAATAMLLLAFTAVAGAQTAYPPGPYDPGAAGVSRAATAGQAGSRLAFTGTNHDTEYALMGAAAVAMGGGLVLVTRRRRTVAKV